MAVGVMLVLFTVFLAIGAPLTFAMALSAIVAFVISGDVPLLVVPLTWYNSLDNFSLLAVPLFVFAGGLMNAGGIAERIVAFTLALTGHVRGGLAQANILTNSFMSAISGSAAADVAAVGSVMIPAMVKHGYKPEFGVVVTSCAAMLASVFPPSIFIVVYASLTGLSVGKMFMAGILPGVVGAAAMMVLSSALAERYGGGRLPRALWPERWRTFKRAAPALMMPVIIIGGIFSGVFTPTEAGAVAVLYGILTGFALRKLTFQNLYTVMLNAAVLTGGALVVLGGASLFSVILVRAGTAQVLLRALLDISTNPVIVKLIVLLFLFLIGMVVEPVPGLILVMPVLTPIVKAMHFDPIQFGISVIMMLILGAVHPPVGILGMIASRIAGIDYMRSIWLLIPFILTWVFTILLVAFVPFLTLWLPYLR